MGTKITEGDTIIGRTSDGNLVKGTEVTVEKPDVTTRVVGAILAPIGIGLLGLDAVERTTYVKTDDGNVKEVKEVVHRSK